MIENLKDNPVFVGGVGGSGTRIVTELVKQLGFFMGNELNQSNDFLPYRGLPPDLRALIRKHGVRTNQQINDLVDNKLKELSTIIRDSIIDSQQIKGWGWKVPGVFFILEHINRNFSAAKYIHVIRNGLDMAFSGNQNQLKNWSFYFDLDPDLQPEPVASLKYWIAANTFAIDAAKQLLGDRFLLLRFEELCVDPSGKLRELVEFLGVDIESNELKKCSRLVKSPPTIGRYKSKDLSIFSQDDLTAVNQLGFQFV